MYLVYYTYVYYYLSLLLYSYAICRPSTMGSAKGPFQLESNKYRTNVNTLEVPQLSVIRESIRCLELYGQRRR